MLRDIDKIKGDVREELATASARELARRLPYLRFILPPPLEPTADQNKSAKQRAEEKRARKRRRNLQQHGGA